MVATFSAMTSLVMRVMPQRLMLASFALPTVHDGIFLECLGKFVGSSVILRLADTVYSFLLVESSHV